MYVKLGAHTMPNKEHGPRYVKSFHEALALSSRRIGFSVTQGCPLRCRHCSVSAAPDLHKNRYTDLFTQRIVEQIPDLASAGIISIDFTGGEPTLVPQFVSPVSRKAAEYGITTGIVTAAHWAATSQQAHAMLARLNAIDHWDISTDVYHIEFVSLSSVERAFKLLKDAGKTPIVRIAHHETITHADALLIDQVMKFADRNVSFQPIGPVGRAEELVSSEISDEQSWDAGPCPTTGLLVQWDGRVAPCCAPASHESHDHPLWLGNANNMPLSTLLRQWRVHPLIQTLRVWGFQPLRDWFAEDGLLDAGILRHRVCDLCVSWLRDPVLCKHAAKRANMLDHRLKLARALLEHFDEPWIDMKLREEAQGYLATGAWPTNLRALD